MNLLRPLSPHLKSTFRRLIIPCIILTPVLLCLYFCFDWLGFSFLKIQSALWQTGLRALFRLVGWECLGPVILLLCVVSGLGGYTLHMEDPAGGQPAANPAAEQPSNVPSGASTSASEPQTVCVWSHTFTCQDLFSLLEIWEWIFIKEETPNSMVWNTFLLEFVLIYHGLGI